MSQEADDDFKDLVAKDVLGKLTPDLAEPLRQPGMIREWYDALIRLKQDTESHLSRLQSDAKVFKQECLSQGDRGRDKWFAYEADNKAKRASVNFFKTKVEQRIAEAKRILREAADTHGERERTTKAESIDRLADRIASVEVLLLKICAKLGIDADADENMRPQR